MNAASLSKRLHGFVRKSSLGRVLSGVPSMPILGMLESPALDQVVGDTIEIRGWATAVSGQEVTGEIRFGSVFALPLSFKEMRLDVARTLNLPKDRAKAGFRELVKWGELTTEDELELSVHLRAGEDEIILGPRRLTRRATMPRQNFAFQLEHPSGNEVVAGDIQVSGWAVALDGAVPTGRVLFDNAPAFDLLFSEPRDDVTLIYDLPPGSSPGFHHTVKWEDCRAEKEQVRVSVELVHGGNLFLLGPYTVSRSSAPILRHQRGSYQEVWDGAASDKISAMASVCGTNDMEDFLLSGSSTAQTLLEALEIRKTDTVLEIGCGVGRIGLFLAERCQKWIGTDISEKMLGYAEENLQGIPNVELVKLIQPDLGQFSPQSVDKLYCSTVFMHLDEWDRYRYICEAWRVLRPGGRCYVDNINLGGEIGWSVFEDISRIDPAQRSAAVSKASTAEELVIYLERAGFTEIKVRSEALYVSVIGTKAG